MLMEKILNYVLSKLPVFAQLNGHKTAIAISLIILTYIQKALHDILVLIPDVTVVSSIVGFVGALLGLVGKVASIVGVPLLGAAAVHNKIKEKEANERE